MRDFVVFDEFRNRRHNLVSLWRFQEDERNVQFLQLFPQDGKISEGKIGSSKTRAVPFEFRLTIDIGADQR